VDVFVLDEESRVLTPCSPARARVLVRDGVASWKRTDPPTIQLKRHVVLEQRRLVMPITNWTEFFREEHDIYVQNIANAQVSIEFEVAPGVVQGFLFSHSRNPLNLTQHVPFQAIRSSVNFRKMLNRRPPVLQLLTEDEFHSFYERKAKDWQLPHASAAIDHAEEVRQGIAKHQTRTTDAMPKPIHEVVEDGKHLGEKKIVRPAEGEVVSSDEVINPRVLHLCNQVGPEVLEKDKMKAGEMLEELEKVESQLVLDDYEYLRAHGFWKSVKKWAQGRAAILATSTEDGDG
jgi:hypothetical protein